MKTSRAGSADHDRMQARTMAIAHREHKSAEGDDPVDGHRELRECALPTQSRAAGFGCRRASGLPYRAGGAWGPLAGRIRHGRCRPCCATALGSGNGTAVPRVPYS